MVDSYKTSDCVTLEKFMSWGIFVPPLAAPLPFTSYYICKNTLFCLVNDVSIKDTRFLDGHVDAYICCRLFSCIFSDFMVIVAYGIL